MITKKLYRLAVDEANGYFLRGWCFNRISRNRQVALDVYGDREKLTTGICNLYRRDVYRLGVHPTGKCGFSINFPDNFDPQRYKEIALKISATKRTIYTLHAQDIQKLSPRDHTPVYFMHIPKTAGSSFNAFLRTCYKPSQYHTHIERLEATQQEHLTQRATGCISGHLTLERVEQLIDFSGFHLVALLRDPLKHLHSHINYVRRVHLDQELEDQYGFQHNEAIKTLAGKLCEIDFSDPDQIQGMVSGLSGFELDFFENIQTRYFLDYRPERVSETDFEQAITNIKKFSLVGITEAYDQFLDRFCRLVRLPSQQQSIRSNRADSYRLFDSQDEQVRSAFTSLIRYDQNLYDYVRKELW
ncbi:MAG: hypothetical protein D6B25_09650 [Desulfobulbaceae bacterium]|nr:MAG: hypothetical protein D6B25_09650 [Desulfobulbaceae bacterium]